VLNWTPEFTQAIRPSLEKLADKIKAVKGLTAKEINPLREINGLWIAGEFVPRPGNKPGETWTTIKFTDVFKDDTECFAAWEKSKSGDAAQAVVEEQPTPVGGGNSNVQDMNKAALVNAFPVLTAAAQKDVAKFKSSIGSVFAADAPEVAAFLAAQVA
jgi:hypothetical protein